MCVFPEFQYVLQIRVFAPKSFPTASWSPICTNLGCRKWSRAPQERPRDPQEEPKSAPERPKSDPRAAKSGPRVAQERPKSSQERPKRDQERPKSGQERPKGEPELRRWAQERARRTQDGPGPPKGRPKTPGDWMSRAGLIGLRDEMPSIIIGKCNEHVLSSRKQSACCF